MIFGEKCAFDVYIFFTCVEIKTFVSNEDEMLNYENNWFILIVNWLFIMTHYGVNFTQGLLVNQNIFVSSNERKKAIDFLFVIKARKLRKSTVALT